MFPGLFIWHSLSLYSYFLFLLLQDVVRQLSVLAYVARNMGPVREIPIIMYLISAMFDTLRNIDEYMETALWKNCRGYINRVSHALQFRWVFSSRLAYLISSPLPCRVSRFLLAGVSD